MPTHTLMCTLTLNNGVSNSVVQQNFLTILYLTFVDSRMDTLGSYGIYIYVYVYPYWRPWGIRILEVGAKFKFFSLIRDNGPKLAKLRNSHTLHYFLPIFKKALFGCPGNKKCLETTCRRMLTDETAGRSSP